MLTSKEELRRELLKAREDLDPYERDKISREIVQNILSLPEFISAKKILLFYPVKGEPDISPLFEEVLRRGAELFLPRVAGDGLEPVRVKDLSDLRPGRYRIPEPASGEVVDPEDMDFIAVPGVAFDREGYRIGFGKGYYDRLLKRVGAPKIGVAYSFQVLDYIPRNEWDEPVDLVVTEKERIRRL